MKKAYTVTAFDSRGNYRKYQTDDMEHAKKKANAWLSHGWRNIEINFTDYTERK